MATALKFLINYVDANVSYATTPTDYIELDLVNDYLAWSDTLADLMTSTPTPAQLNAAATQIDPNVDVTVPKCLLVDASADVGGAYYTHLVMGMSANQRYVYAFSFDGATASEPQLEAWDDSNHNTFNSNVLGIGVAANSMLKGIVTTSSLPGTNWVGTPLAGATNVLKLNDNAGALGALPSGILSQELYCNLKIVIPAAFAIPGAETFITTVRYTWS